MRYLDPKNDLTFKKIFGQHPHLLKSFLNALMPLEEGQRIVSLEYLPAELVPEIPVLKHSIVDVRCVDNFNRQFIVEMQMLWTDSFKSRVLFNASKAYVKQLEKSKGYKSLDPVFSLSLVNQDFEKDTESYYHHYNIVHSEDSNKKMEGLEFTRNDGKWSEVYAMYLRHRTARNLPIHALPFLQQCILFNAYWEGALVSTITCYDAHPYLRIQNIFSKLDGDDKELRRIAGFAARRLVYEICTYGNGNGYQFLDMASANFTNPAKAGITQFKNSFGGVVSDEYTYTYKNALLRLGSRVRNML